MTLSPRQGGIGWLAHRRVYLAALLPASVQARDTRTLAESPCMFPEESHYLRRAGTKRRLEFATVRTCAAEALRCLGVERTPLVPGKIGAPDWPQGIVGSMTHTDGYYACAVAREDVMTGLGIDAEPNAPLPTGVIERIASPEERTLVADLAEQGAAVAWDRLLFCAKEALYKATSLHLYGSQLSFSDVVVSITREGGLRATVPGEPRALTSIGGSWAADNTHVLAVFATPVVTGRSL